MDYYQIKWTNSAKKELKKLDKNIIPRLINAVEGFYRECYEIVSKNTKYER